MCWGYVGSPDIHWIATDFFYPHPRNPRNDGVGGASVCGMPTTLDIANVVWQSSRGVED